MCDLVKTGDGYLSSCGRFKVTATEFEFLLYDGYSHYYRSVGSLESAKSAIGLRLSVPSPVRDFISRQSEKVQNVLSGIIRGDGLSCSVAEYEDEISGPLAEFVILAMDCGRPEWYSRGLEEKCRIAGLERGEVVERRSVVSVCKDMDSIEDDFELIFKECSVSKDVDGGSEKRELSWGVGEDFELIF